MVLLGIGLGVFKGQLSWGNGLDGGPWEALWVLLAWVEFGALVRWAGGFPLRGPLGPLAFLGGALIGELPATILLAPRAADARTRVRVALTASAGALLSPVGSPVTLLVLEPGSLGALPFLLAALAWPRGWAQDNARGAVLPLTRSGLSANLAVFLAVVGSLLLGGSGLWTLATVAALLLWNRKHIAVLASPNPWGLEAWIACVVDFVFSDPGSGAFTRRSWGWRLCRNGVSSAK